MFFDGAAGITRTLWVWNGVLVLRSRVGGSTLGGKMYGAGGESPSNRAGESV
jgi:hypothetical protein